MKNLLKDLKHWLATTFFLEEITFVSNGRAVYLADKRVEEFKKNHVLMFTQTTFMSEDQLVSSQNIELPWKIKEELLRSVLADMERKGAIVFEERKNTKLMSREYTVRAYTYSPKEAANL